MVEKETQHHRKNHRTELANFLRTRRARISPELVGLPPGMRRRTPGLRREEVAQLVGVGITWYTWLEQGRDISVSVDVLENLVRVLRLNQDERMHLFTLAGKPLPTANSPFIERVSPVFHQLLTALDPYPAHIRGQRGDVLAWNRAESVLCPIPGIINQEKKGRNGSERYWKPWRTNASSPHRSLMAMPSDLWGSLSWRLLVASPSARWATFYELPSSG